MHKIIILTKAELNQEKMVPDLSEVNHTPVQQQFFSVDKSLSRPKPVIDSLQNKGRIKLVS